jgi:hypothetical protein
MYGTLGTSLLERKQQTTEAEEKAGKHGGETGFTQPSLLDCPAVGAAGQVGERASELSQ